MTAVSNTINVTNTTFDTVENLASITMTNGNTYSIQIQGIVDFKVANAIFTFIDKEFTFTQGTDAVYIRSLGMPAKFTILENEEGS